MIATFMSILLAVVLVAMGCAPKVIPVEGPQISAMMLTNVTASAYDTVPFMWNVRQNTLQSTGTPVLHANNTNGEAVLLWRSGSPLLAVQHWSYENRQTLMTATSKDLNLLVPPVGMQYPFATGDFLTRWYVPEENTFVTVPEEFHASSPQKTLDGTTIAITEQSLASSSKAQTLTVPVPSGLTQIDVVYGSGNIKNGFVLVEASEAKEAKNAPSSLWLLRMNNGMGSWVRCGDTSAFGGTLFAHYYLSFAHVGSLLYMTHSHTKIACIDTATASPSVTLLETMNTLLAKLYREGPTNAEGPLQALLASDNGTLIIEYPDVNWNNMYYAVDAFGTVLGSLRADKTSIMSFDAKGQQGFTLTKSGYVSFPSIDLFQANIF
jgi:hypothetical protein